MIQGMDISGFQEDINWTAVKESGMIQFVYSKATEGLSYVNDAFTKHAAGAKAVGIPFGAYHFFHFNTDPDAQARHFLSVASGHQTLLPMVDVEVADGVGDLQLKIQRLATFNNHVEKAMGGDRKVIIYSYYSFWKDTMQATDAFSGHPFWLAEYTNESPDLPGGFKSYQIWQNTDNGHVPGVGAVDLDRLNVPLSDITL